MRRIATAAAVAVLVLAACTTGSSPSISPTSPPVEPTAASTPTPAPTAAPIDVRVRFDGTECIWEGPTVFLDGTRLMVEFVTENVDPDEVALVIAGVFPGTTWEEILASAEGPASIVPDWFNEGYFINQFGPGTTPYTVVSFFREPLGGHFVGCATSPTTTDEMVAGALLLVAGGS